MRFRGVRLEHDSELGRQQLARTEDLPGAFCVLDWHEVRMGTIGGGRREPEHPRAERGKHDRDVFVGRG